ncbi:MAG: cytochrome c oxidase subunit 3 [Bacteroidota bacterium]
MSESVIAVGQDHFNDPNNYSDTITKVSNWKMFMWLFLAQDAMTFFTMFVAYLGLRISQSDTWPVPSNYLNIPKTAVMTFILICSSVTMVQALAAIQRGDQRKLRLWLSATVIGGILFLFGQYLEYSELIVHEHLSMSRSLFDATFFILTSFHGLHVLSGVIYLASVLAKAGRYTAQNYTQVEIVGLYWHFVDLVWIILFTLVYLI